MEDSTLLFNLRPVSVSLYSTKCAFVESRNGSFGFLNADLIICMMFVFFFSPGILIVITTENAALIVT